MFKNVISRIKVKTFWFITYLSVLLLPFIVCSYNYLETYNIIKKEINTNNYTLLQQLQNVVDSHISDFNKISLNLQMNDRVKSLSYADKPIDIDKNYLLYQLKQELSSFKVANVAIGDIVINFRRSDMIVNTRTTYSMDIINYIDNEVISGKDWSKLNTRLTDAGYRLFSKPEFSSPFLARTLVGMDSNNIMSTVAITFNEDYLIQNIRNNLPDKNANICIVDDQNRVVISTDAALTSKIDFSSILKEDRLITLKDSDKTKHVVSIISSKVSNWRYIYIVPKSIYNQKLYHVSSLLYFTLVICAFLGLLIIYVYSKLNYRPVERILSFIGHDNKKVIAKSNEFNIILKTLEENHTEMFLLQKVLRNTIMMRILMGEVKFSLISAATLEKLELHLTGNRFLVVIIRIANPGVKLEREESQTLYPSFSLLKFAITNVFEEITESDYNCNFCESESDLICILSPLRETKDEDILNIKDNLLRTIAFFLEEYNAILSAGVSELVADTDSLSFAYSQAKEACEYIQFFEEGSICFYKDIDNNITLNDSSGEENNYLINVLMSGKVDEVKECLEDKFRQILSDQKSLFEVKYFMYYFYRTSLKLKNILIQKYGIDYPKEIENIHDIFTKPSLKKISSMIEEIYLSVCKFVADNKNKVTVNVSENICQYIDNNYIDTNLNVTNIAAHFDFTPAYLSKKFKEDIGVSIVDYIYKVRVKQARQLISNTNLKVADIATMIGFVDSNAFIRIFKRIEGVTPGAYKEMNSRIE